MQHVAIDLGSKESQICVRDAAGEILLEKRTATKGLARWLSRCSPSRVVVETCSSAFAVADLALQHGHEVRVVPGTLVRSLGVGSRGLKNDQRDARVLSEVSCRIDLPSVHVPSAVSRDRKANCTSREALVKARTQLINRVRGYMRSRPGRSMSCAASSFAKRAAERLVKDEHGLPAHIERLLVVIETLTEQIRAADQELSSLAKNDDVCRRMMTVPGVGPVTAIRVRAAMDQVQRFDNAAHLASYFGLTPGENTTGFKTCRTGITKAGSADVRRVLVQAAWSLWRTRPHHPLVEWAEQVAQRRGRQIAAVGLARKLVRVLYAIWRDGSVYDPRYEAKRRAAQSAAA